tara:strand:- start:94 stop:741 length:648 start_codon:yes stop_codon:yes gene_type:complete
MSINDKLRKIQKELKNNTVLVAVSKTRKVSEILEAYNCGQKVFGENRVQELVQKNNELPQDIEWHMIGHLQSNKVRYIAPFVDLIHSVDSLKLLSEINKRAIQNNRIIDCLIQVHIAKEDSKFGFKINQITDVIYKAQQLKGIKIKGLMGMATFTNNRERIINEFSQINTIFQKIKTSQINILSIGMSSDYLIAVENGSNMVRIGSAIFGSRRTS